MVLLWSRAYPGTGTNPSAERVKHLIEATRLLERGQGLFLFTDLASLVAHDDILTLPWQTCQTGKTETLR